MKVDILNFQVMMTGWAIKMINISSLKPSITIRPPKIMIYGTSKIGKSTFASHAPNPVVLDLENGMESIEIAKHKVKTFSQVMEFMRALYSQEHDFKYLIVDSIDWLERLMIDQLCSQYDAKTLGDRNCKAFSYGAGERLLLSMWNQFIVGLDFIHQEKNMGIILIAHNQIKKFDDPLTESYDQHSIKLEKKCGERLKEWVDCILFATLKVKTEKEKQGFGSTINKATGSNRVIYTERRPSFEAGNRFKLPYEIDLTWNSFYTNFNKYYESLKKSQEEVKENNLISLEQSNFIKTLVTSEELLKILRDHKLTRLEDMNTHYFNILNEQLKKQIISSPEKENQEKVA